MTAQNEAFDLTAREAGDCSSRKNVSVHAFLDAVLTFKVFAVLLEQESRFKLFYGAGNLFNCS